MNRSRSAAVEIIAPWAPYSVGLCWLMSAGRAEQARKVPLNRVVQADPLLGDELEDDRRDEGLGDAADPDFVAGLRGRAGAEVRQPGCS
jgi:hypothetical protein